MAEKKTSIISNITLNAPYAPTFKNEVINKISFVNFFYGNNGVGKTSISYALENNAGITTAEGKILSDYEIFIFNRDFILNNFSLKNKLKALYTLGKGNIEKQKQANDLKRENDKKEIEIKKANEILNQIEESNKNQEQKLVNEMWDDTADDRQYMGQYISGLKKNKQVFIEGVVANTLETKYTTSSDIRNYVDTIFKEENTEEIKIFNEIKFANFDFAILSQPIYSSSSTAFAQAVKAMNNISWLQKGHNDYHREDGKCPYCQQPLPANFEEDYKSCFDEEYNNAKAKLESLVISYKNEIERILSLIDSLCKEITLENASHYIEDLKKLRGDIESYAKLNYVELERKIADTSLIVELKYQPSIEMALSDLNGYILKANAEITEYNLTISKRKELKKTCPNQVIAYFSYVLSSKIANYNQVKLNNANTVEAQRQSIKKIQQEIVDNKVKISELGTAETSAEPIVKKINETIKHSGFQGFHLQWDENDKGSYQVVYNEKDSKGNYKPATKLSEGELNFIAFLYFYHLVVSPNENGDLKDSIVLIDDPVSSMDSQALFIVSSRVKELIDRCLNASSIEESGAIEERNIKQIFILTHNVYFHSNVTQSYVPKYSSVTYYKIWKESNVSHIKICEGENNDGKYNINPIVNSYAALWRELDEVQTSISACNIIQRILLYYFINLSGYTQDKLCKELLDTHKDKFITTNSDGTNNYELFNIVRSFLEYLGHASNEVGNEAYIEEFNDVNTVKETFKLVFEAMHQTDHYNLMTRKQ